MIIQRSFALSFGITTLFSAFENKENIDLFFNDLQQNYFTETYNDVRFNVGYYLPYNLLWLSIKSFNSNISALNMP